MYVTVNVNAGSTLTVGNLYMTYCDGNYSGASSTLNVSGILNVNNLQYWSGNGYSRTINLNTGGQINATTINMYQGTNFYMNGGTLANLAGTNLTSDSGTPITLTGNNTLLTVSPTNSITINGTIGGGGSLAVLGSGTYNLTAADNYTGSTTIGGGTLNMTSSTLRPPPRWSLPPPAD